MRTLLQVDDAKTTVQPPARENDLDEGCRAAIRLFTPDEGDQERLLGPSTEAGDWSRILMPGAGLPRGGEESACELMLANAQRRAKESSAS
jgi:hypothetical protein